MTAASKSSMSIQNQSVKLMMYRLVERDSALVEVLSEQGREGFSYKKHNVDDQQKALRLHSQYWWFYTVNCKSKPDRDSRKESKELYWKEARQMRRLTLIVGQLS